jgi:hypothetical protein
LSFDEIFISKGQAGNTALAGKLPGGLLTLTEDDTLAPPPEVIV